MLECKHNKALSLNRKDKKMSKKRRDNKNRILRKGESQRPDGRYAYKYIDLNGETKFKYSWRLVPTDTTPSGKRKCIALREMIKEIERDLENGIDSKSKMMTVSELYKLHTAINPNVKPNTKKGRKHLENHLNNVSLGNTPISKVTVSVAKKWALQASKEHGFSFGTINNYKRSLKACFYTAINDGMIQNVNPFNFKLSDVLEDDTDKKVILSKSQVKKLLTFISESNVYQRVYTDTYVLLNTGLRISELCGLTVDDIDFENQMINVDKQLLYNGKYYISSVKTDSGVRSIPMSAEVSKLLKHKIENLPKLADDFKIDEYSNFIFLNTRNKPMTASLYQKVYIGIARNFNEVHIDEPISKLTPHMFRHYFASKIANDGIPVKSLQYVMGHANLTTSLNYYVSVTPENVKEQLLMILD